MLKDVRFLENEEKILKIAEHNETSLALIESGFSHFSVKICDKIKGLIQLPEFLDTVAYLTELPQFNYVYFEDNKVYSKSINCATFTISQPKDLLKYKKTGECLILYNILNVSGVITIRGALVKDDGLAKAVRRDRKIDKILKTK